MKRSPVFLLLAAFLLAAPLAMARQDVTSLYEISTLDNLLAGHYDGQPPVSAMLAHGDWGIGTFHELDGEMIVLDGRVYQVRADGKIREMTDRDARVPFALAAAFGPGQSTAIAKPMTYSSLQTFLDSLRSPGRPMLFKIHGRFPALKTRSVPRQRKPYPKLSEVIAHQPVFEYQDVTGTLVGLWSPAGLKSFTGSGYHFHFISDDRKAGGHVLDLQAAQAEVFAREADRLEIALPETWPLAETAAAPAAGREIQEP